MKKILFVTATMYAIVALVLAFTVTFNDLDLNDIEL